MVEWGNGKVKVILSVGEDTYTWGKGLCLNNKITASTVQSSRNWQQSKDLEFSAKTKPKWFTIIFELFLLDGMFPEQWKSQKSILIPKPQNPLRVLASNRAIFLLNTMEKCAGCDIQYCAGNRLLLLIELAADLSKWQYEFRRACSPVDTIPMVVNLTRGLLAVGKCCAVVLLDVTNAFNSIKNTVGELGVSLYWLRLSRIIFRGASLVGSPVVEHYLWWSAWLLHTKGDKVDWFCRRSRTFWKWNHSYHQIMVING